MEVANRVGAKNGLPGTEFRTGDSGCSSIGSKVQLLQWKHCDTFAKQIGFIFGGVLERIGGVCICVLRGVVYLASSYDFALRRVVQIFVPIGSGLKKGVLELCQHVSKIIFYSKHICINEFTRTLFCRVHGSVLSPTVELIGKLSHFVFKIVLRDWTIGPVCHGLEFCGKKIANSTPECYLFFL